ncbi:hypothetical protein ACN09N_05275 [Aliarcobacter butzleri]|uniref:hypothetical protein n=1 Tax=Aliarcobacter butzleri TaxID=28197 RepID=UPI003AE6BD0A
MLNSEEIDYIEHRMMFLGHTFTENGYKTSKNFSFNDYETKGCKIVYKNIQVNSEIIKSTQFIKNNDSNDEYYEIKSGIIGKINKSIKQNSNELELECKELIYNFLNNGCVSIIIVYNINKGHEYFLKNYEKIGGNNFDSINQEISKHIYELVSLNKKDTQKNNFQFISNKIFKLQEKIKKTTDEEFETDTIVYSQHFIFKKYDEFIKKLISEDLKQLFKDIEESKFEDLKQLFKDIKESKSEDLKQLFKDIEDLKQLFENIEKSKQLFENIEKSKQLFENIEKSKQLFENIEKSKQKFKKIKDLKYKPLNFDWGIRYWEKNNSEYSNTENDKFDFLDTEILFLSRQVLVNSQIMISTDISKDILFKEKYTNDIDIEDLELFICSYRTFHQINDLMLMDFNEETKLINSALFKYDDFKELEKSKNNCEESILKILRNYETKKNKTINGFVQFILIIISSLTLYSVTHDIVQFTELKVPNTEITFSIGEFCESVNANKLILFIYLTMVIILFILMYFLIVKRHKIINFIKKFL